MRRRPLTFLTGWHCGVDHRAESRSASSTSSIRIPPSRGYASSLRVMIQFQICSTGTRANSATCSTEKSLRQTGLARASARGPIRSLMSLRSVNYRESPFDICSCAACRASRRARATSAFQPEWET